MKAFNYTKGSLVEKVSLKNFLNVLHITLYNLQFWLNLVKFGYIVFWLNDTCSPGSLSAHTVIFNTNPKIQNKSKRKWSQPNWTVFMDYILQTY